MIQSDQPLPVTRRCELLKVARSTAYCRPGPVSHEDVVLMRLIDEIHLELPFYGSRRIRDELETRGHPVNRKRVQRLMRHMGVAALYPTRRTSAPGRGHSFGPGLPGTSTSTTPGAVIRHWTDAPRMRCTSSRSR